MAKKFGYKKYLKPKNEKKDLSTLKVFLGSFVVMLVVFTVLINRFAPDVDVSIGNSSDSDEIAYEQDENEIYLKKFVDNRLLAIQQEDQAPDTVAKQDTTIPSNEKTPVTTKEQPKQEVLKPVELVVAVPEVKLPPIPDTGIQAPQRIEQPLLNATYRVYIGYYHTYDQVKLAKEIVSEADSTITQVIKEISGGYTLQAGVFKSKEAAVSLTNSLLKEHLPARLVTE